jgi:hypothetical protein
MMPSMDTMAPTMIFRMCHLLDVEPALVRERNEQANGE